MNSDSFRKTAAIGTVSFLACGYAGVKLWKAHPVWGGIIGAFIVGPSVSWGVNALVNPQAFESLTSGVGPVSR